MVTIGDIDQLRRYPQAVTGPTDAPLEDGSDIEPLPDAADIDVLALEGE
jgi:hypothetical protein